MSTGTYLKPFRPPAPLKPGGASNAPGRKPWARRPPPKLCTSGFLSGSWKPPKRVTVAKPATSRLAKRCREVAAAHPPTVTNEDELSVESTAADSALWEAVAKDAAELDETDGCEEIDFSDVRMDEASEAAARAAKRARRESGADGPPVLRPASAAVGKPERRETLVVNDDAPTVEVASEASAPAAPSPKLKPASQKDEAAEEPAPAPPTKEAEPQEPEPTVEAPKAPEAPVEPASTAAAEPTAEEPPAAPTKETEQTPEQRAACLGACDGVLKYLLRHKHAAWFADPVDPVGMGIPHYAEIIKQPMDFGTIKGKYKGGRYASAEAFAADVRLVFRNATTFNTGADEPVHVAAVQLGAKFEERFESAMEDALYESSDDEEEEEEEPARRRR
ncbi:unnamed protein product [Pelagomonas calceolata]|uniref:Bromo domain-containing protein n=1 Tax=Pelagomonas calceolata TaxID=35677 RepID=A0A7S4EBL1_9STRA|nr:unnamed protein product [Pelagomonas calceolata]|mmetsp:Transcript_17659/g.50431  ORF Transcript_17659/g.50431 Transcript_17659/m.50431 type:complete len:391 (+) Transcript_17659:199-1371(+)